MRRGLAWPIVWNIVEELPRDFAKLRFLLPVEGRIRGSSFLRSYLKHYGAPRSHEDNKNTRSFNCEGL
jgi:hypothetical protein